MALDITPGPSCESLCSVAQATAYHDSRGNSIAWGELGPTQQEVKLRAAYDWLYGEYAALWPDDLEFGATDLLGTIPPRVRDASALLALYAIEGPLDAPPDTSPQLVEKTVGPLTKKYAVQDKPQRRTFPDVARMIAPYLVAAPNPYSAKLVRS